MVRYQWGLCSICPLVMEIFLISGLPWLTQKSFRNQFPLSHINRLWFQWVKCPHGQKQDGKTWNWVLSPFFFPLNLKIPHSFLASDKIQIINLGPSVLPLVPPHPENACSLLASTSHYEKDMLLYCILHTSSPVFCHPTTSHPVILEINSSSRKLTVNCNL